MRERPGPRPNLPKTEVVKRFPDFEPVQPRRPREPPPGPVPGQPQRGGVDPAGETQLPGQARTTGLLAGLLIGIEGDLKNEVFKLFEEENILGRETDCRPQLLSPTISKRHAKLVYANGLFVITPISDKPTVVNGEKTSGTDLADGAVLQLGENIFIFRTVRPS